MRERGDVGRMAKGNSKMSQVSKREKTDLDEKN